MEPFGAFRLLMEPIQRDRNIIVLLSYAQKLE